MARTKTSPGTAPSAAHAATETAPAPGTAPAPDSPAAAVHAALAANPGGTVAVIADAAGTGKPAARAALLAMEADGTATRVKGTKPGIPDTWTLAGPAPDGTGPADPEAGQAGQPGKDPGGSPDNAGKDETADGTGQGRTAETGDDLAPQDGDDAGAGPGTAESGPRDDAPAEDDHEDAAPGEQDAEAAPGSGGPQDRDDGDAPADEDAPAHAGGEAAGAPDPALVTDLTERLGQIKAAADAAAIVLTGAGTCAPRWRAWTRSTSRPPRRGGRSRPRSAAGRPRPSGPAGCATRCWPTWTPTPAASSPRTRSTR